MAENQLNTCVDNFNLLRPRLHLLQNGDFYPIIILKRKKDNPDMSKQCQVLYRTNIYNIDDYISEKTKIINICHQNNARAYIKVNRRNDREVSATLVKYVLEKHLNSQYDAMRNAYDHVVGTTAVHNNKYYHIDVDSLRPIDIDNETVSNIINKLIEFKNNGLMANGDIIRVPTKNGLHILAPAFNVDKFEKEVEKNKITTWSINKDAETLLYFEN